jgi:ATP-dependent protease HslVU (ClpYQ) peptidase subunit
MTCIVAIEHKGSVYIGGDSAYSGDNMISSTAANEKIFILDNVIIGVCGSMRTMQVIHHGLKIPVRKEEQTDMTYLTIDFVDALRKLLKDKATISSDDNCDSLPDTGFLLGYNKKLFEVDTDMQIVRPIDSYAAMGSGGEVALGSLFTTKNNTDMSPEERITIALEAAAHHTCHVRPKFHILRLANKRKIT